MKLTKNQQEVIDLLNTGWSLGQSKTINGRDRLQKDGLGKGGETKDVRKGTIYKLSKLGLIKSTGYGFPSEEFKLVKP